MKLKQNSGQVFSLISILMTVVFLMLFSGMTHVAINNDTDIKTTYIERIDDVVQELDTFVLMTVDTAAYQVLNFSLDYIRTVDYFDNYTQAFNDCFAVGQFDNGTHTVNCSAPGENSSLPSHLDDLFTLVAEQYNLTIDYSDFHASLGQKEPYKIFIDLDLIISVKSQDFSWNRFVDLSRDVSIVGITDPLTINKPYERAILLQPNGGELVTAASFADSADLLPMLIDFMNNSYYFKDERSISFIERFENYNIADITEDRGPTGVTSFIPPQLGNPYFNQTSHIQHHASAELIFQPIRLRRFDVNGGPPLNQFNTSFILHELYGTILGVHPTFLDEVADCCDSTGCVSSCG